MKSQDPREGMRVKSLQMLCFKLANHKDKILQMLEKYNQFHNKQDDDNSGKVPFDKFKEVMLDFSLITGLLFM